jgi:hypothetical protein
MISAITSAEKKASFIDRGTPHPLSFARRALLDSLSQESADKAMALQQKIQEEVTQQLEKLQQDPAAVSPRLASKTKQELG